MKDKIICWWSGGVTSAVACWFAIQLFGKENCVVVFMDTGNEDDDTYRFMRDCEKWYGLTIGSAKSDKYGNIEAVWEDYGSLNSATGAICSTELKRQVRIKFQKENPDYKHQVFGYDIDEAKRVKSMTINNPDTRAIYPLLLYGYSKKMCIELLEENGIRVPNMYYLGFLNNNCFKTGCVQGGIGYWQKIKREYPEKFEAMAEREHRFTNRKGSPVTMLKDQSNEAKKKVKDTGLKWMCFVFLKKHPDYPMLKSIDDFPPLKVEPLFECNGFCGTNDLEKRNETEQQLNFEEEVKP